MKNLTHTNPFLVAVVLVVLSFSDQLSFAQIKTISTNLTGFTVPFNIDNSAGTYIEVQLFTSTDRGQSWSLYARKNIDDSGFPFQCQQDGEFWFALKTLDRNQRLIPSGKITSPELVVFVDRQKPLIEFSASSDAAGRVTTDWQVRDNKLAPETLKISYRSTDGVAPTTWTSIEANFPSPGNPNNFTDRVAWWPKTDSKQIEVQLEISDKAGNRASASSFVSIRKSAFQRRYNNSTTLQHNGWVAKQDRPVKIESPNHAPAPSDVVCKDGVCLPTDAPFKQPRTSGSQKPVASKKQSRQLRVGSATEFIAPPEPSPGVAATNQQLAKSDAIEWKSETKNSNNEHQASSNSSQRSESIRSNSLFPIDRNPKVALGNASPRLQNIPVKTRPGKNSKQNKPTNSETFGNENIVINQSSTLDSTNRLEPPASLLDSRAQLSTQPSQSQPTFKQVGRSNLITNQFVPPASSSVESQLLFVNSQRFNLNYDIHAIDSSGVSKVVLWATRDGGQTWNAWSEDSDQTSPIAVEVPEQGVFGFKVAIHSNDGLVGKPPSSGDEPDILVHVDLKLPTVALTSAPFGSGKDVGKLVINWQAADPNLKDRPINLAYSPTPDGPWTTIKSRLRNTGTFAWRVSKSVPEEIFLRIEAIDAAQNIGSFQLTQPISLAGLVPRGRITSVDPIR
ncbi:MAG: hypothetical protein AAGA30_07615 [Planctomycetota bacterium]